MSLSTASVRARDLCSAGWLGIVFTLLSTSAAADPIFADSNATGFFISDDGHLVTAFHAVENRKVAVVMQDQRAVAAEVIKTDKELDLALLRIPAKTSYLKLALPDRLQPGMEIVTIGYPLISVQGSSAKISRGIINSLIGFHGDKTSFQFDASTARGNSGGPVIGPGGLVIGVVNGKLHTTKVFERTKEWIVNVNYATATATLLQFLEGVAGLPAPRPLDPDAPVQPRSIFNDAKHAVVPVISDMANMRSDADAGQR